jgi:hypothetical protein
VNTHSEAKRFFATKVIDRARTEAVEFSDAERHCRHRPPSTLTKTTRPLVPANSRDRSNGSMTISEWLGHTKLETTAKYLNMTTQYLHEVNKRKALTLVAR